MVGALETSATPGPLPSSMDTTCDDGLREICLLEWELRANSCSSPAKLQQEMRQDSGAQTLETGFVFAAFPSLDHAVASGKISALSSILN